MRTSRSYLRTCSIACVVFHVACQAPRAFGDDKTTLGKTYPAAQRVAMETIDHSSWDGLLHKYVDTNGLVNYAAWKRNASDLALLDQYIGSLGRANPRSTSSRSGSIAFWINAYSAETIRGILTQYPSPVAKQLVASDNFQVSLLSYDWGLNEQKPVRTAQR